MKFINLFILLSSCLAQATYQKGSVVVGEYFPGWRINFLDIPFNKFTHLICRVGVLDGNNLGEFKQSPEKHEVIKTLVKMSKQAGVKPLLTIFNDLDTDFFSRAVSPPNRDTFIKNIVNLIESDGYKFEGINFYLDFSGHYSAYNRNKTTDQEIVAKSENILEFLKKLREALRNSYPNETMTISASAFFYPNEINQPADYDISKFAELLDFVILKPYLDMAGQFDQLKHSYPVPEIKNTINSWLNSGLQRNKLVLGLGSFIRGGNFNITYNCSNRTKSINHLLCNIKDQVVNPSHHSSGYNYRYLDYEYFVKSFLNEKGVALDGYVNHWDANAQASWLYNHKDQFFISYNSFKALIIQVELVKKFNLKGVMIPFLGDDFSPEQLNFISYSFL